MERPPAYQQQIGKGFVKEFFVKFIKNVSTSRSGFVRLGWVKLV